MVSANLHIICGNCGSKNVYYRYIPEEERDYKDEVNVELCCSNCSTIHFPSEYNDKHNVEDFMPTDDEIDWNVYFKKVKEWQEREIIGTINDQQESEGKDG